MVVQLEQVAKNFGERRILEGVSLSIQEGERIGLIGPNGAGKSTLLNLIADLFFFSSRRRHTRSISDWSADVCSSDLFGVTGCCRSPRGSVD